MCTLLGIPATDLQYLLGTGPIPTVPPEVAVGIPAELLRRRPDVRQAERLAAAQAEQIGIAEAQLYPTFSITGAINWQAANFKDLFTSNAFNGSIGPQFQWNILNYGRLRNNVLYQDALLKDLVVGYQATVLQASQDVENGIVTFLRSQVQAKLLEESVRAANKAVNIVVLQYECGAVDFNRYATIEQALVTQQDLMAAGPGADRPGIGASVSGDGRRLGDSVARFGGRACPRCRRIPTRCSKNCPPPLASPPMRAPETIPPPPVPPPVVQPAPATPPQR